MHNHLVQTLPSEFKRLAEDRYAQWHSKLDNSSQTDNPEQALSDLLWSKDLLFASDYAFEWALKEPDWLIKIDAVLKKDFSELTQIIESISASPMQDFSEFEVKKWLRKQRHFYSICFIALQITKTLSIRNITALQSLLARQLISSAYRWVKHSLSQQYGVASSANYPHQDLVIMLMGKLGGGELNFSSDIDLIFCYPEEGETLSSATDDKVRQTTRAIDNQKYFRRLAQKLIALLHENTADGFVYRVDMRLRPYGESGALTLNFDAMADYYLEQGREWERFAMIKADYFCLDIVAKKHIQGIIQPFSFRRYIDFSVLDSIRQLKQKITTELQYRNLDQNIKLGHGGIRELEFIVQSLQLISGGRHPELQLKNWWHSLEVLTQKSLISNEASKQLSKAYEFLREVENILQFRKDKQIQDLPSEIKEQQQLALLMDFPDWQSFHTEINVHRDKVAEFFQQMFHDGNNADQQDDEAERLSKYLSLSSSQEFIFNMPTDFDQALLERAIKFKRDFVNDKLGQRGQKKLNQLLPYLVLYTQKGSNPNVTLERGLSLIQAIGKRTAYFELLAENLPLLEHLMILVSRSNWLVEQLKQSPSLLDELLFPANFGKILSIEDLADLLRQSLLRVEQDNIEERLLAIGRFKVASQFKVAAGFLNHRFNILDVTRQLTDIAELVLDALLELCWYEMAQKHGVPENAKVDKVSNFLILGYGKLGSHELGFGSDLDLVFLYQSHSDAITNGKKPIEISQFYTRLTQRLVHYLNTRTAEGSLYEVDTRLRPSGRSGLLVSEFEAFVSYQKEQAWTWEKQALTRARSVAGDKAFAERYKAVRLDLLATDEKLKQDVVEMRQKMRTNLDRSSEQLWDIKQGHGGLVDIEFLVQYWVLKQSKNITELPNIYSNAFWLKWLQQQQCLEQETALQLSQIYEQYQTLINQKRLDTEPGLIQSKTVEISIRWVTELWTSTFTSQ
ncbi:bifunctional [glutamate--ammonia ligase]-adenylyl-L-tyrosine phosphorylase/[glutamate--ammonia-ligase] adenylyltransferase [Kangiella sp. HZ709]|uniref:bifunctional [glutamate--ammonia ligase]-adenylyl-L-tyrosine phosphorylase/[glutamate--ammonia-ligase] adenylyltransferase n=1 Tax=Kangiella sp. HZ709 TaxID=2666328 RepID=UPI0012AF4577|nr:bifunctional [glutamate--ammonia ligase]-adenylyl-L-tyrosine phosphorylase/[glutamate--ammonia-ligase] adenylyltransferase [Kangiella sp. HZ709]